MARPRTVSDADVLDAALGLMQRQGPQAVTFASVGAASGLSPATLVQRYGSKDQLVEAALLRAWDMLDAQTHAADLSAPETPEGAVALLLSLSDYGNHDQYAEGLLLLREDIRNPALRARGEAWGRVLAKALGRRLSADPERQPVLGRLLASQWQGALIWWGFSREGTVSAYVLAELKAFIAALTAPR